MNGNHSVIGNCTSYLEVINATNDYQINYCIGTPTKHLLAKVLLVYYIMSPLRTIMCMYNINYRFLCKIFQVTWITVLYITYFGIRISESAKYNQGKANIY